MVNNTARDVWDKQAKSRVQKLEDPAAQKASNLYEESCWRFIEPLLPAQGSRVLEAGCGTGRWVQKLAPLGYRVTLSDFSPEMIRVAQEQAGAKGYSASVDGFEVLDLCDMNTLGDESFDMVLTLGEPLGLCGDAPKAVTEMKRLVRPGGIVACDCANRLRLALDRALDDRWDEAVTLAETGHSSTRSGLTHQSFTPQGLRALFEDQGFEVLHLAALCPFMTFPPRKEHVEAMNDEQVFEKVRKMFFRFAEDEAMLGVSIRLMIVARRK